MPLSILAHGLRQNPHPKKSSATENREIPVLLVLPAPGKRPIRKHKPPIPPPNQRQDAFLSGWSLEKGKISSPPLVADSLLASCRLVLELGWFSAFFPLFVPVIYFTGISGGREVLQVVFLLHVWCVFLCKWREILQRRFVPWCALVARPGRISCTCPNNGFFRVSLWFRASFRGYWV